MAFTKHMTGGDLLRIRKAISEGVTDIGKIQERGILIHATRIQEVLDTESEVAAAAPVKKAAPKKKTAAERAKEKATAKVDPLS